MQTVLEQGPHTLIQLLRNRAAHQGERQAFTFLSEGESETNSFTYAALDWEARRIAAWLQERGLAGERVLLLYPPGDAFLPAFLGCLYAGAVAVPAYPPRPRRADPRWQVIRADADARVVFTVASVLPLVQEFFAQETDLHFLATDTLSDAGADAWQAPAVDESTLALLQYTSGSTGTPRGVMITHGNIMHNSEVIRQAMGVTADCCMVSWLPAFHDMGLIGAFLQPLYSGFPGYLMAPVAFLQQPLRWLRAVARYRATHSGGPNFAYELCRRHYSAEDCRGLDLSSWRVAWNGSEPIAPATLERFTETFARHGFHARAHYPCYGLAEGTLMVTGSAVGQGAVHVPALGGVASPSPAAGRQQGTLVHCGTVGAGLRVVIAHPKTRVRCRPGEVGEIWVAGPSVAQGYWRQSEATEATFQAFLKYESGPVQMEGPFLRTGDLGFFAGDHLVVTGRLKDLIILGGRNYYPQDIEQVVQNCHPAFQPNATAAFTVEGDVETQLVVVAEVERSQRRAMDAEALGRPVRSALAEQLGVPLHTLVLVRLLGVPKTSSGKIQRRACREAYLTGDLPVLGQWRTPRPRQPVRPRTCTSAAELEQLVKQALAAQLDIRPAELDLHRPLAELGLESLQAAELSQTLAEALGVQASTTLLFNFPTAAALVRHFEQRLFSGNPGTTPVHPTLASDSASTAEVEDLSEQEVDALFAELKIGLLPCGVTT
jgi:acyl-CoA synthetase (AMP-forming)/AMP-acid ligase II/acyl carrier protein